MPRNMRNPQVSDRSMRLVASVVLVLLSVASAASPTDCAPERHAGRDAATVVAIHDQVATRYAGRPLEEAIAASDDVQWLERIAGSADAASEVFRSQSRPIGQPKDLRVAAFARLGDLGTDESLAAQRRIAAALIARSMIAAAASLTANWPHPGWHMGDYRPVPLARIRTTDGERLVTISMDLLGPWQLFVLRCEDDELSRCSRPKPLGPWAWRYVKVDASLKEVAPGRLTLTLVPVAPVKPSIMDGIAPVGMQPAAPSIPDIRDIVLTDVDRDSDADGWTDLEERTLGLDPARADSDGDGIDDAHDRAPLYAPAKAETVDEDVAILQAAIFAAFGLSESRWALFAKDENVKRLQVPGLSAPVLFNRPLRFDPKVGGPGGVFVTWKILRTAATEATVEITDWEGPLAAGGQNIFLRRINDEWVVVARQTTWIS